MRLLSLAGLTLAVACAAAPATAQVSSNLGGLTPTNVKGYAGPLGPAMSGTLNSAIFTDAKIAKTGFHLNLGIMTMGMNFDDEDRLYTPTDPAGFTGSGPTPVPTVIGNTGAVLVSGTTPGTGIYYPGGFNLDNFQLAVPQLTIGNVAGTRAVVRWIAVELGDDDLGKIDLLGIGAQHSISQYFKDFPMDLAIGGMYQSFKLGDDDLIKNTALHFDVMASRSYGMIMPYVAVGFDNLTTELNYDSDVTTPGALTTVDLDDESGVRFTAGATAGLSFVKLTGEFSFGSVNAVAAGLRFGN